MFKFHHQRVYTRAYYAVTANNHPALLRFLFIFPAGYICWEVLRPQATLMTQLCTMWRGMLTKAMQTIEGGLEPLPT